MHFDQGSIWWIAFHGDAIFHSSVLRVYMFSLHTGNKGFFILFPQPRTNELISHAGMALQSSTFQNYSLPFQARSLKHTSSGLSPSRGSIFPELLAEDPSRVAAIMVHMKFLHVPGFQKHAARFLSFMSNCRKPTSSFPSAAHVQDLRCCYW